jgi:HD superfamily phosphohydrolase
LKNASDETRSQLESGVNAAVRGVLTEIGDLAGAAAASRSHALTASHFASPDSRDFIQLAEAGLRLAALFHDLGHLPLSHDFEEGLEDFWYRLPSNTQEESPLQVLLEQQRGRAQIHERVGHALALLLMRHIYARLSGTDREAIKAVFALAVRILESPPTPDPSTEDAALQFLHLLTDGELDVDRCDYILRDGRNHSFEFATYDLERLLDNLVVVSDGDAFILAMQPHGLSAVESFLVARYRSYQYGVRHHKVAQVGAALRYTVARILNSDFESSLVRFKEDLAHIARGEESPEEAQRLLDRFAQYDDVWWTSLMRQFAYNTNNDEWVNLVCWRARGPRSLWKRAGEFPAKLREWNSRLPSPADLDAARAWADAEGQLRNEGILVVRHRRFTPWRAVPGDESTSVLTVQLDSGTLVPVTDLSPVVASLREAWMSDIQVQAFATSGCGLSPSDVIERLVPSAE